jgi:hypothetical protein
MLHHVAWTAQEDGDKCKELVKYLLEHDVDPNQPDEVRLSIDSVMPTVTATVSLAFRVMITSSKNEVSCS